MAALILRPPRRPPPATPGVAPPPRNARRDFRRVVDAAGTHWPLPTSLAAARAGPAPAPSRISGLGPDPPEEGGPGASQSGAAGRGRAGQAKLSSRLPETEKLRLRSLAAKVTPDAVARFSSNPRPALCERRNTTQRVSEPTNDCVGRLSYRVIYEAETNYNITDDSPGHSQNLSLPINVFVDSFVVIVNDDNFGLLNCVQIQTNTFCGTEA
jgi:hypothetical protein